MPFHLATNDSGSMNPLRRNQSYHAGVWPWLPAEAPTVPQTGPFREELRAFKVKINPRTRRASFGGRGAHDDLVLAVALAVWGMRETA